MIDGTSIPRSQAVSLPASADHAECGQDHTVSLLAEQCTTPASTKYSMQCARRSSPDNPTTASRTANRITIGWRRTTPSPC